MDFSPIKIRSKSITSLHTQIDALSSALERFHYENGTSSHLHLPGSGTSSIAVSIINDTGSELDTSGEVKDVRTMEDSGICDKTTLDGDLVAGLEQKIDKLSDLFQQQSSALAVLREDVRLSRQAVEKAALEHSKIASELINMALLQRLECFETDALSDEAGTVAGRGAAARVATRAQALLDALQVKRDTNSIESVVKEALTEFLQSDALREHVVAATAETVKQVVQSCFASVVTTSYLPTLERSHRQFMQQVSRDLDDVFREMETSTSVSRSSQKTTRAVRSALERHRRLLEDAEPPPDLRCLKGTLQKILEKEITQWRGKVIEILADSERQASGSPQYVPSSPPQPAEPGRSAIEQLMSAAEINVQMKEDVNGTFEKVLLASDLTLVMAACRAADPARVFAPPCRLQQHVLLSLAQQLAADLVHDTQLKCRYLEDTIMNLDVESPATRAHLPKVLGEVCANLTKFLEVYPSHMSSRKIRVLILAASSLL